MTPDDDRQPDLLPPLPPVESRGDGLRLHAAAKLNLNLLVGPPRDDGYHPLDSIYARISFYDRIDLTPRSDGQIEFSCEGVDCGPAGDNLALRAARLLAERVGDAPGAAIRLAKRIPPGAGLGGGSSDAAAVLGGLNQLWNLDLDAERLSRLAMKLGSDVPLFLGPTAGRMTGRGEILQPAAVHPFTALLVLGAPACSTAAVYRQFDADPPARPDQLDPGELAAPPSQWRDRLDNQLAAPAERVCPQLAELRRVLGAQAGLPAHVTGSGSALFVLCDDLAEARAVLARLDDELRQACVLVTGPNPV